jgi:TonB family protein
MDKPIFPTTEEKKSPGEDQNSQSLALRDLSLGKYDELFKGAPDKPSDLYLSAQFVPPVSTVRLVSSTRFSPDEAFIPLQYPLLARMTNIEGSVSLSTDIDSDGNATNLKFEKGHPILEAAITGAAKDWKFPRDAANQHVQLTFEFALNCHSPTRRI